MPQPNRNRQHTSDCCAADRRQFLRAVAATTSAAALSGPALGAGLFAGHSRENTAETAVGEFFRSLSDEQKKVLCFPFEHDLRHRISANWHVTEPTLGQTFYSSPQRQMVKQIVQGLCSEDGFVRLEKQMDEDAGGLHEFSVAVFGEPGAGEFEFLLTGRHLTLRADGNSVDKAAFGGPIIYGHDQVEEDASKNIYFYQTQQTDQVFRSLTADQAAKALVARAPREADVAIQGERGRFSGIKVSELSADQKQLVTKTLDVLLAPYRRTDVDEVMQILNEAGGVDQLHMAFYQDGDLGNDQTWDIWRVEGPSFVWHYRGAPHVHAYINIGHRKQA